jgi:apolipoprotein D and lipocalin family protein
MPVLSLLLTAALTSNTGAPAPLRNTPVAALDLARYSGEWHEVARLPMYFQRNCAGEVTANYTQQPDGTIKVQNACRNKAGGRDQAIGVAKPVPGRPGALKVRFAPAWLSWAPAVWADYWVVELDPEYRWAVVGGPSLEYLWVLSRTPAMDRATFDGIRARASRRGYPVQDLLVASIERNGASPAPTR